MVSVLLSIVFRVDTWMFVCEFLVIGYLFLDKLLSHL